MLQLRDSQRGVYDEILDGWQYAPNVVAVMPTGSGKTVLSGQIIHDEPSAACMIAHRQELVGQISLTFARFGVPHRIVGPKNVVKMIVNSHMDETGRSWYNPGAPKAVAGVDTLVKRASELTQWAQTVRLWIQDEAHHVLDGNKWGKAAALFPNARGLGVTATPCRADGKGLGRHADGLFDHMVIGPTMRELINGGELSDYRVARPPSDLDVSTVAISKATGDYNKDQLVKAVRKSHIVGDIVQEYKRFAAGTLGITFVVNVEIATEVAAAYRAAGVPAEVVSAKTPAHARENILRRFRKREIHQLVNVDLFGEGFDVPAVEVVSMGRPTESFAVFSQQFGRALRIMDGKDKALIIDHVGNTIRHGLPDAPRAWTLDRRERGTRGKLDDGVIPVTTCTNPECATVYERLFRACPYCGHVPIIAERSGPEHVDGDLEELDAETLAAMRGEVARIDAPLEVFRGKLERGGLQGAAMLRACRNHTERQEAQAALRDCLTVWRVVNMRGGRPTHELERRFYHTFGVDMLTAQALGRPEAEALIKRIRRAP